MAEPAVTTKCNKTVNQHVSPKIGRLDCTCGYQCRIITRNFTIVCLVTWPMNGREASGDLGLIQTSLLSHKCQLVSIRTTSLHNKRSEVFIKTRSPGALLPFKGQVTKQTKVSMCTSKLRKK